MASMWITRAVVVASVVMFICISESKPQPKRPKIPGIDNIPAKDFLDIITGNKKPRPTSVPIQPTPVTNQPAPSPNLPVSSPGCGGYKFVSNDSSTSLTFNISPLSEFGGIAALHNSATDLHSTTHRCGASLISDRFLITSAHCVTGTGSDRIISISLGREDLDENPTPGPDTYEVESITIHPNYGYATHEYDDIAILKTNRKVHFSDKIWPFCLPERNQVFEGLVQIAGWGLVSETSKPSNLHTTFVRITPNFRCLAKIYEEGPEIFDNITKITYPQGLTDQIMCGGRHGVDACAGDDGGPMIHQDTDDRYIVIGIIAKRIGCPDYPTTPGFYTNVAYYTDWIYDTTGLPRPSGAVEGGDEEFDIATYVQIRGGFEGVAGGGADGGAGDVGEF